MPGHDITLVLLGCFILAFGWFGFNPGSTLGASGAGNLRISVIAVNTMVAGALGSFASVLYMWIRFGKPDASMGGNGLLAGLVAITAPSGFVNPVGAAIIGFAAGMLVCLSVEFIERVMRVDDPVGAISVHGTCGLWGVISVGLFADGTYGGGYNGVATNVTGLFYGNPKQLVAQLIGCATLAGIVFTSLLPVQLAGGWDRRTARQREHRTGRPRSSGNGCARLSRISARNSRTRSFDRGCCGLSGGSHGRTNRVLCTNARGVRPVAVDKTRQEHFRLVPLRESLSHETEVANARAKR